MPNRSLNTRQDCLDFLTGLKLFGTGGGGPMETGIELLDQAMADQLDLRWIDAADMPEDASSCTVFGSGALNADIPKSAADIDRLGEKLGIQNKYGHRAVEVAVRELEKFLGAHVGALVPVELGAGNGPAALVTAARMGLPVIDGDYSGRAVPQDMQTTYFLNDIPTYPAAMVNWWGDVVILKESSCAEMGERIGKFVAAASYGVVYMATILLSASDTRKTIVPGTLTSSLELGQAVHRACSQGQDPIQAAVRSMEGWKLFTGVVTRKDFHNKETASEGTAFIQGTGEDAGHDLEVYFFNENEVATLDGKPYVTSPDLIILANPETGEGYTNTELKPGDPVAVMGAKVHPAFRTERAVRYFGPRYWGFDFDYVPIEEVMKKRG